MLYKKSENGWELCTIANGHLSCDNPTLKADDIDSVEKLLMAKFGESMENEHIIVSYDNWSGVFVMQMTGFNTDSSDEIINGIFVYLSNYVSLQELFS